MGKIIAVGGGENRGGGLDGINKRILAETGRRKPRLLFIPTASRDNAEHIETTLPVFEALGAQTDTLLLAYSDPSPGEMREKILSADVIYAGGGDTAYMLFVWRRRGVDTLLTEAYDRKILLSGISAGASCWFSACYTDSEMLKNTFGRPFNRIDGITLARGIFCPHSDHPERQGFRALIEDDREDTALAAGDGTAFFIKDGKTELLREKAGCGTASVFARTSGKWTETKL